jgi:hypothetical protein
VGANPFEGVELNQLPHNFPIGMHQSTSFLNNQPFYNKSVNY